jgi:uncharacterized membrane-anchored protein YjiN (DUF445 family)
MSEIDPDLSARRSLSRHRSFATFLLLLMAALTIGSFYLPHSYWTELLQASAKAGFVGGIADWFAVTALFRHPLGLPIPHTAIIPREKLRLGQALGRFLIRHVVTEAEVNRLLGRLDVAEFLRTILTNDEVAKPLARTLAGYLPRILASVEDGRARRTLNRLVPRLLGNAASGRVVARALRGLVEGGRHQEVLGFILGKLRVAMLEKEGTLRRAIEERVRDQGGRFVGWALGASIASRVLNSVNAEMDKMDPDSSELRAAFDEWVRREIDQMEQDPARAAELGRAIRRVIGHETVQAWTWDVWSRLRATLEADAAKPGGHTELLLEGAVHNLGKMLAGDPAASARVQRLAERAVGKLIPAAQSQMADFVAGVVASWDTQTLTDRIELRVGRDLQYVRMNGTLVGFLVGGLAFAALTAAFGHVAF